MSNTIVEQYMIEKKRVKSFREALLKAHWCMRGKTITGYKSANGFYMFEAV